MTVYSLVILLSQFWTSLLFHVQFCSSLTCIQVSQETGKVVWYSHFFKNFHTVKGFGIVSEAEVDFFFFFWNSLAFSMIPQILAIWSLVPLPFKNSACISRNSLFMYYWTILACRIFEYYLTNMWNECNCTVVWTFFGIVFLWDWNENWPHQRVL